MSYSRTSNKLLAEVKELNLHVILNARSYAVRKYFHVFFITVHKSENFIYLLKYVPIPVPLRLLISISLNRVTVSLSQKINHVTEQYTPKNFAE